MSTIAGLCCRDGVVIAGDRVRVRDGRIESRNRQHVLDLPGRVGAAAVGRDIDRFADRLAGELRSYRFDRETVSLEALERIASDVAGETGVDVIVATHDEDGRAALSSLSTDGAALSDAPMAFGSGTSLVLGGLEAADTGSLSLDEAETLLRETFAAAAERDPGTGAEIDCWTLSDFGVADGGSGEP